MIEADGSEEKVAALPDWRNSDVYTPQERVAIEYGERMTITGQVVDDELFEQLKHFFSAAQIVELTAGIAMENFRSKFNAPLRVESQGFCVIPQKTSGS